MLIMSCYCEGSRCNIRNRCKNHIKTDNSISYFQDFSITGGGHCWQDAQGHSHCNTWVDCGPEGHYKYFKDIEENAI